MLTANSSYPYSKNQTNQTNRAQRIAHFLGSNWSEVACILGNEIIPQQSDNRDSMASYYQLQIETNRIKKTDKNFIRAQIEPLMADFRTSDFFQHCDQHQLLYTIARYHNMQNQQKQMHTDLENGLKPHLAPFQTLDCPSYYLRANNFFYHLDIHYILDIVISNYIRLKLMHISQENGLKPHFGPFLALIGPFLAQINFFSKIGLRHFVWLIKG